MAKKKLKGPWQNRIVGHGVEKADQLLANPSNFRIHPENQQKALEGALQEIGWISQIIVNRTTGHLIDGHLRVKLALRQEEAEVPVMYVELTEEEEKLALATLDPLAALAAQDDAMLADLLSQINTDNEALKEMLDEMASSSDIVMDGMTDADAVPETPEDPESERGKIYQLGNHRVMCGDSTSEDDVQALMNGEKADMVFTDPPYTLFGNSTGAANVSDDKMVRPFFRDIIMQLKRFTKSFAHCYMCCDWHSAFVIQGEARKAEFPAKNLCVWYKGQGGIGAMYTNAYEFIWFFSNSPVSKNTSGSQPRGARTVNGISNVWEIGRADNHLHNAAKPIGLISIPICASTGIDEMCLDPFLGSGSTLIACEKLNRQCYGMEIDEHYVDVIRKRWAEFVHGEGCDWESLTPEA